MLSVWTGVNMTEIIKFVLDRVENCRTSIQCQLCLFPTLFSKPFYLIGIETKHV